MAIDAGSYAGKVSGAGGGGFMMFMVDPVNRLRVINRLSTLDGGKVMNFHFTNDGTQAWRV
jgi:D-glycero-alpha-D-manno-heptose-7-phosphate kinase